MMVERSAGQAQLNYLWAGLIACLMFGCSNESSTVEDDLEPRRDAILGGQLDTTHTAVVAVTHTSGACTGTIIDARDESAWILTAAHCVVELDEQFEVKEPIAVLEPSTIRVTVGSDYARDLTTGAILTAVEVRIDPRYNGFSGNPDDIALVRVLGNTTSLSTLPLLTPASDDLREGEPVTLVGFGMTEDPDNTQRHVTQQTVAWLDQHFIGIDQTNGIGVCHGDSGGPVLVVRKGNLTVAGVNSVGTGTRAEPCSKASTSTRVASFSEFITNALSGTERGPAEGASGGAGGGAPQSPVTANQRSESGCALSRSGVGDSPRRLGLLGLLGFLLVALRRRWPRLRSAAKRREKWCLWRPRCRR